MIRKFLTPGEFYIGNKPAILETLVGSCVCVCLYNFKNGFAAMNHFLRDRPVNDCDVDVGEFGSTSTEHIISKLMAIDDAPFHYRAMVFGGAAVIKTVGHDSYIGRKNIDVALKVLADIRIRIVEKEILGKRGRRVAFNTETGTVKCRFAGDVGKKLRG
ncbi:MAG: chemotaxis protein CheD [Planctomycetota bacterium]|jgi:chemotaxis protein CheD